MARVTDERDWKISADGPSRSHYLEAEPGSPPPNSTSAFDLVPLAWTCWLARSCHAASISACIVDGCLGKILQAAGMVEIEVGKHDVAHVARSKPLNLSERRVF